MKKILIVTVFSFLIQYNKTAYSQGTSLNITLSPTVISVRISDPPVIQLSSSGYAKHDEGINAIIRDHINIVSSGAYIVKVAIGDITGNSKLSRNSIKITPQLGSGNRGNLDGLIITSVLAPNLQINKQITIIEADHASWNGKDSANTVNISYLIGTDGTFAGRIPGTSVIPVIYTVILK